MEKEPKKILSIYCGFVEASTGTPLRVKNIVSRLPKYKDCQVVLYSFDEAVSFTVEHHQLLKHKNLSRKNPLFYKYIFSNIISIIRHIKNNKTDIVIGHTLSSSLYLLFIKVFTKAKIVLEMHGFIEEEKRLAKGISPLAYWISKAWYVLIFFCSDFITACSETAIERINRFNKKTLTIFGGVNFNIFNPETVSEHMFKDTGIIIGYAGNTSKYQGLDFLLDIFKDIKKNYPDFKLKLLLSTKSDIEMVDGIEIFDRVDADKVPSFLINCDILVIPRKDNIVNKISFPSKLPEYMAMGKAIVASRTSDMHKIIKDGLNGLLFDPGDALGAKEAILKLLDEDFRNELGRNACLTAKNELSWEIQVERLHKKLIEL